MYSIDKVLTKDKTPEWVFSNIIPLALHFREDNTKHISDECYAKIADYIKENINPGQRIIYPVSSDDYCCVEMSIGMLSALRNVGLDAEAIHVPYSPDGVCQVPIGSSDIVFMRSMFDILTGIDPNVKTSSLLIKAAFSMEALPLVDTKSGTFGAIYTELKGIARGLVRYTTEIKNFSYLYKYALNDAMQWYSNTSALHGFSISASNLLDPAINKMHSILNKFYRVVETKSVNKLEVYTLCSEAIAAEVLILWVFTGNMDNHKWSDFVSTRILLNEAKIAPTTMDWDFIIDRSIRSAVKILKKGASSNGTNLKPAVTKKDALTVALLKTLSKIIGMPASANDISYEIPEERLAMLVSEYGGSDHYEVAEENSMMYHYYVDNDTKFRLFIWLPSPETVYGVSSASGEVVELVQFAGDDKVSYQYTSDLI